MVGSVVKWDLVPGNSPALPLVSYLKGGGTYYFEVGKGKKREGSIVSAHWLTSMLAKAKVKTAFTLSPTVGTATAARMAKLWPSRCCWPPSPNSVSQKSSGRDCGSCSSTT